MDQARKEAKDIGRLLESKQIRANSSKSKAVIIGQEEAREKLLKEIKENPILMGNQIVGESASEKYLGDWISQYGTAISISETIKKRLPIAVETTKQILTISEDPRLIGFPTAWGAISEFKTKVIPQLLNNAESWLGIKESDIKILQNLQDNYVRQVFQVSAKGTPRG